jgi:hypothetical protein
VYDELCPSFELFGKQEIEGGEFESEMSESSSARTERSRFIAEGSCLISESACLLLWMEDTVAVEFRMTESDSESLIKLMTSLLFFDGSSDSFYYLH